MKNSCFNYFIENKDKTIIKNSRTGNVVSLKKDYMNSLSSNEELADKLLKLGIVVEEDKDEIENYLNSIFQLLNHNKTLTIMIATTYSCNFKCSYCYENGIKHNGELTKNEVDKFFCQLYRYCCDNEIIKIAFVLFGGEPLQASIEILEYISEKMKKISIPYETDVITNGYNYNQDIAKILKNMNTHRIQITLDGMKNSHDLIRITKNNEGTFDRIISNIDNILAKSVTEELIFRINCTKTNISEIGDLIAFIHKRYNKYCNRISFSFGLLMLGLNEHTNLIVKESSIENDMILDYCKLYKKVYDFGFPSCDFYCISNICMNKMKGSIMVTPGNKYFKCMRAIGRKQLEVDFNTIAESYLNKDEYKVCIKRGCSYIPYCHLGCLFNDFLENGTQIINCRYELLDKVNKGLLEEFYVIK